MNHSDNFVCLELNSKLADVINRFRDEKNVQFGKFRVNDRLSESNLLSICYEQARNQVHTEFLMSSHMKKFAFFSF